MEPEGTGRLLSGVTEGSLGAANPQSTLRPPALLPCCTLNPPPLLCSEEILGCIFTDHSCARKLRVMYKDPGKMGCRLGPVFTASFWCGKAADDGV